MGVRFPWVAVGALLVVQLVARCGMAQPQAPSTAASGRDVAVLHVPLPGSSRALGAPLETAAIVDDGIWQRSIASHAYLITRRGNLDNAMNAENSPIRSTKWFASQPSPDDALTWLGQHLHATPVPGTALIEVSIDGGIPANESAAIVNAVGRSYLEYDRRGAEGKLVEQIDLFQNLKVRYDTQAKALRTETSNLAAILQLDGMGRPGLVGPKEQELQLLTAEKLKAVDEASLAENALKLATEQVQAGNTPAAVELQLNQAWEITGLRQNLMSLRIQMASVSGEGENSKAVQGLKSAIEATQRELDQRVAAQRKQLNDAYLASLNGQFHEKSTAIATKARQIDQLKGDLADLGARLSEYLVKRDEETAYRELSRRYADQLDRLNVTRQQIDIRTIDMVAPAYERPQ